MATTKTTKKATKEAPVRQHKPAAEPTAAKAPAQVDARNGLQRRKEVVATVVSNKMQKTIVVEVDRQVRHGMYAKYMSSSRRFKAHDEKNEAKPGDQVVVVETRPLSRDKRYVLKQILRRAGQTQDANV